jgi:hypothetical protein
MRLNLQVSLMVSCWILLISGDDGGGLRCLRHILIGRNDRKYKGVIFFLG